MNKLFLTTSMIFCLTSLFFFSCKKDKNPDPTQAPSPTVGKGQFLDTRDNQVYDSIRLGTQTWMKQNLNYNVSGSKCPSDLSDSCKKYGKLYTYTQSTSACPAGWHLPTDAEWKTLETHYGMTSTEVDAFSAGSSDRGVRRDSLLDSKGFNALYSGYFPNATYNYDGTETAFWAQNQLVRKIDVMGKSIQRNNNTGGNPILISVRCIKD
jgi:uncharacterized protein (TIGR02145 family)